MKKLTVLNETVAKKLIIEIDPEVNLSFSSLYETMGTFWFPENRTDIAVAQRDAENGLGFGCSAYYVIYNRGKGTQVEKLGEIGPTMDNRDIWAVEIVENSLLVRTHKRDFQKNLFELGLN